MFYHWFLLVGRLNECLFWKLILFLFVSTTYRKNPWNYLGNLFQKSFGNHWSIFETSSTISFLFQSKLICNMDEVILRFPHLGVQMFQELDVGSLLNCKQVGRSWENFIETEKPLNDKFLIMRVVYYRWKALPTCLDWVENNFYFIMNKFKRRGIHYNISYMRISVIQVRTDQGLVVKIRCPMRSR